MRPVFIKWSWLMAISAFAAACSPTKNTAKILIELPEATPSQKAAALEGVGIYSDSGWGYDDLVSFEQVFCYALFIGAEDHNGIHCHNEDGQKVAQVGSIWGTYRAGSSLEIETQAGPARTLYLVGLRANSLESCSAFKFNGSTKAGYSRPHILSQKTIDLQPGENLVTLTAQVTGATPFESCLAPGETAPPSLPPPGPIEDPNIMASLSDLPAALTSDSSLHVAVGGEGVSQYRYKVGSLPMDCSVAAGYTEPQPVATVISDSLSVTEGQVRLCVLGGSGENHWQPLMAATSFTWELDRAAPHEPSDLTLGPIPPSLSMTPVIGFTDEGDRGAAGIDRFEIQIHQASDDSIVLPWSVFVSGQSLTGLSLSDGQGYYAKVRAIDRLENTSAGVSTGVWIVAGNLMAVINGAPESASQETALNALVEGTNITAYRSKLGPGSTTDCSLLEGYSASTPVVAPLTSDFSGLPDGLMKLCVVGSNGEDWQPLAEATVATWLKDTTGPMPSVFLDGNQRVDTHDRQIKFMVHFDEPVTGFDETQLDGSSVVTEWSVTGSGATYQVQATLEPSYYGLFQLQVVPCAVQDTLGNCSAGASSPGITRHAIRFAQMEAGGYHTCAVTKVVGDVYCWGYNEFSQVGDGNNWDSLQPVKATQLANEKFKQVVAGTEHTCALTEVGTAYCWGQNGSGQIGADLSTGIYAVPQLVGHGLYNFTQLASGSAHTCGLTDDSKAYCWGANSFGQLGNGTTAAYNLPQLVAGDHSFVQLSAGEAHTCGVTSSSAAYCWGSNSGGQLGDNTTTSRTVPTLVAGSISMVAVAAGHYHSCGVTASGEGRCWGENISGQLGTGQLGGQKLAPQNVGGLVNIDALSAGGSHTCAVAGQEAYCWGDNSIGQLGDNDPGAAKTSPALVVALDAQAITVGADHSCSLDSAGVAHCWGENSSGQLGIGTTVNQSVPSMVLPSP